MTDQSPPQDLSEEVAFWRGFIEWWAREREGPVPPRAWEALTYAEAKRNTAVSIGDLQAVAESSTSH